MRITYHCWTESMILSLVDLQEGQFIPQYYYVSNSNRHVTNFSYIAENIDIFRGYISYTMKKVDVNKIFLDANISIKFIY